MEIKAIVHPAEEGGYWAEVPSLPGCFTEGETIDEIMVNLKESISGWLDVADRREEIYHNTQAARAEQQAGTLKFSSDINELKQLMEEDSSV
jgi:predicted RNase H-like HicB family nuclease